MGIVRLVDGNGDAVRGGSHLPDRIDDAAVVLAVNVCGEDEQTIGELAHGIGCHRDTPRFLGMGCPKGVSNSIHDFLQNVKSFDRIPPKSFS